MTTIIVTPTPPNLQASIDFYTRLNFKRVSEKPLLFTDGKVWIEVNTDRYIRPGIKILVDDPDQLAKKLEPLTRVLDLGDQHILSDPTGTRIYLAKEDPEITYESSKTSDSLLGNFSGISLEAIDTHLTIEIWKKLGFEVSNGSIDQGWVSLKNESGFVVSIMKANSCPHLFINPSLTYFNGGNNQQNIAQIRQLNIPILEEITHFNPEGEVDNIIIQDPGGYGIFVFSD